MPNRYANSPISKIGVAGFSGVSGHIVTDEKRQYMSHRLHNLPSVAHLETPLMRKKIHIKSPLNQELMRINRENKLDTLKQRKNYRPKHASKYVGRRSEEATTGAEDDVVKYAMNNPGFCYRRNGECRVQPSCITSSSVNMQDLHILLFTKGEIDIDKVLCLYLLTAHKTDTLRSPPRPEKAAFVARQQSPLERLIDRSKKNVDNSLLKMLPLYVLDVPLAPGRKSSCMKEPRIAGKIIVNVKILQIVESVRNALEVCNPELMRRMMHIAQDRRRMQAVMKNPKMLTFCKNLYGQNIISSCESFHVLTMQRDTSVSLHVEVEPLNELVRIIRYNVLLLPNSNTWKMYLKLEKVGEDEEGINKLGANASACSAACDAKPTVEEPPKNKVFIAGLKPVEPEVKLEHYSLHIDGMEDDTEIDQRETNTLLQPKILKNLQMGFSEMQMDEYEDDQDDQKPLPLDELAVLLSKKVRKEVRQEYRNMAAGLAPPNMDSDSQEAITSLPSEPIAVKEEYVPNYMRPSLTFKPTTCAACMARYMEPSPTPKISKIKKFDMPDLKDTSYFSSRSAQRISQLIDAEVKKFEEEESSIASMSREANRQKRFGNYIDNSIEIIDLDEMELAKIRQEIKEVETMKKLKDFLQTPAPQ